MIGPVLIVIPCAAAKLPYSAPADRLYASSHFAYTLKAARSEAAETTRVCGQPADVAILSALHGLLDTQSVVAPYDLRMGQPGTITAMRLAAQLIARQPCEVVAMLPAAYRAALTEAIAIANDTGAADITLLDAYEAAPGIGYQRGVAASLLRTAGHLPSLDGGEGGIHA